MSALLGCPCCTQPVTRRRVGGGARSTGGVFQDYSVWLFACAPCGLQRKIEVKHEHGATGEDLAIDAWNTRAESLQPLASGVAITDAMVERAIHYANCNNFKIHDHDVADLITAALSVDGRDG